MTSAPPATPDDVCEEPVKVLGKEILTDAQRAQIERNRQRALLLRQSRLSSHNQNADDRVTRIVSTGAKFVDSGGGFLVEETSAPPSKKIAVEQSAFRPPVLETSECTECHERFLESTLLTQFDVSVCNNCRDDEDKHAVITKTDAKNEFLLKDVDLDKREPILKFIVRKNPHNPRWGDMKLFLRQQVFERAIEVWGSEEDIEEQRTKRVENREKGKQKKFNKRIKELRMSVRSSTYTKDLSSHQHIYGPEEYDEEEDMYRKKCTTCSYECSYEKM